MDWQNNGEAQENIESVLKNIEKHIPIDQKIFNWGEFYPSSFMIQFAHKLRARNLDYVTLYNRTGSWDYSWMLEYKFNYTEDDYLVLEKIFQNIHVNPSNHKTQMEIDIHVDIAFKNYELFADKFEHNGYSTREKFALGVCDAFLKRDALIRARELAEMTHENTRTSLLIRIAMHCIENNDYNQVVAICHEITHEPTKFDELLKVHNELYNKGFDALPSAEKILFIIQKHVENTYLNRLPNRIQIILKEMIKYPGRHGLDIFEKYDQHGIRFSPDLMADIAIKYIELENLTTAFKVFDRCGETLNYGKKLKFHIRIAESTNPEIIPNIDENYRDYFLGSQQQIETFINEIAQEQLDYSNVTRYLIPNLRILWNARLFDQANQLLQIIENAVDHLDDALDRKHCYYNLACEVINLNLFQDAERLITKIPQEMVGWKIELYLLCSDKFHEVNQVNIENNDPYFERAYNIWRRNKNQDLPYNLDLRNLIKHKLKWNEPRTIINLFLPSYSAILIDELLITNNADAVNALLDEFNLLNHLNSHSLIELSEYYFKNNLEQRAIDLLENIPLTNASFQIYLEAIRYNFHINRIDAALILSDQIQRNCHTLSRYEYGVQLSKILRSYNYEDRAYKLLECMLKNAIERKHFEHLTSIVNELYISRNMYNEVKEIARRIFAQDNLTASDKKQCLKLIDCYNVHALNPEIKDILKVALIVTSELKSEDKNNILENTVDQFMLNDDLTNALYIAELLSTDSIQKFINENKNALLTVKIGQNFIFDRGSDQDKADLARHYINGGEINLILPVLERKSKPEILLAIWKEYVDFRFANPLESGNDQQNFNNYQQHFNIDRIRNEDVKIKVLFYLSEKFYEDHNFILAGIILSGVEDEINRFPLVGNAHDTALQKTKLLITLANHYWTQNDI